jgi:hypothetical protein
MRRGERYALIPQQVLESQAFRVLPHYAVRVLIAVAGQYNGSNNGSLALTAAQAHGYGVDKKHLVAGLELLQMAQLITKCRQGGMRPLGVTRYAITWRGIDPGEFDHGIGPCPIPSHAWARWSPPGSWREIQKLVLAKARGRSAKDKSTVHPVGSRSVHPVGTDKARNGPPCGDSSDPSNGPHRWDTSKTSGGTPLLRACGRVEP